MIEEGIKSCNFMFCKLQILDLCTRIVLFLTHYIMSLAHDRNYFSEGLMPKVLEIKTNHLKYFQDCAAPVNKVVAVDIEFQKCIAGLCCDCWIMLLKYLAMDFIPSLPCCVLPLSRNLSCNSIFLASRRGYTCNLAQINCHLSRIWNFRCLPISEQNH